MRAPVIEIHTGAWCDAVVDGQRRRPTPNGSASSQAPGLRAPPGSKSMPATVSTMDRGERSLACRDRGAEYRLLHDR